MLSVDSALALGEEAWAALAAAARSGSPFASRSWLDAWRGSAPDEEVARAVTIVALDEQSGIRAALPVAVRPITHRRIEARALVWAIGDVGCPDHLDVLASGDAPFDAMAAALEELEWDMLQLDGIAPDAMGAPRLAEALRRRGMAAYLQPQWSCPYIELPSTWDGYLASRSASRADVIVRRERTLARRTRLAITFYNSETLTGGWEHFRRLHDARWDGAGAFDPRLDALHRRFAAANAAGQTLWLSTIDADGEPISAWYGFTTGDTLYFYQSGRDAAWHKYSVGGVHIALMLQRAIALGLRRFDFLRGDEPYKSEWTSTTRWTRRLLAFRRSARGRALHLAERASVLRDRFARAEPSTTAATASRSV